VSRGFEKCFRAEGAAKHAHMTNPNLCDCQHQLLLGQWRVADSLHVSVRFFLTVRPRCEDTASAFHHE
jgi:hypothetical protein